MPGRKIISSQPTKNLRRYFIFQLAIIHHQVYNQISTIIHVIRPGQLIFSLPFKKIALISNKFSNVNYVTALTPTEVLIYDGNNLTAQVSSEDILQGWRDEKSGLWQFPLQQIVPPPQLIYLLLDKKSKYSISNVYDLPSTEQIFRYLYACAGFPTKSTWLKFIKGGKFATWPHLSEEANRKHFPESDETHQVHMRAIKQNIRSTKKKKKPTTVKLEGDREYTILLKNNNDIYVSVDDAQEKMYNDQTGAFLTRSRKGNIYVMILCEIDNNGILGEAMKKRTSAEMVRAYQVLMKRLKAAVIKPKNHVIDNERSGHFKQSIMENGLEYEFVPKGNTEGIFPKKKFKPRNHTRSAY